MNTEISNSGFLEIPVLKQQEINGGLVPFLAGLALAALTQVIRDWDNFKNGLMGEPEERK
jgi:hypothetical protein